MFVRAVVAVFVVGLAMLADALSRLHGALFLVCFDAVVFRLLLEEDGADGAREAHVCLDVRGFYHCFCLLFVFVIFRSSRVAFIDGLTRGIRALAFRVESAPVCADVNGSTIRHGFAFFWSCAVILS